ncbi:histidyl-tRNA synthetase [compost metagenome]
MTTAAAFRAAGSRTAVDIGKRKLKKTLAAANTKGIRYIILIGESEAAEGKIRLKDMLQQSEELLTVEAAIAVISK